MVDKNKSILQKTDNQSQKEKSSQDIFNSYNELASSTEGINIINPDNWYKTFPYEIAVIEKTDPEKEYDPDSNHAQSFIYSLPIPPEAISIAMLPASTVTPTLDGVVEETNTNKFWSIAMNGTFGISANRSNSETGELDTREPATVFRKVRENLGLVSGTLDNLADMTDNFTDLMSDFKNDDLIEAGNKAFTTQPIFSRSAVSKQGNGYVEMHLFHRFLYAYSALKDKNPNKYLLKFRHHKDGTEWRIIIQEFRMIKSKTNPYMYRYSFAIKGWDMQPIINSSKRYDRFAEGGDLYGLKTFTVTGALLKMANLTAKVTSGPSGIINALSGGAPII